MSKYTLAPAVLPEDLIWHKWQSYWTWISGFALLCWVYYGQSSFFLIDPAVLALEPWQAALIGVARWRSAGSSTISSASRRLERTSRCWRWSGSAMSFLRARSSRWCSRPRRADPHRRADGHDDDRQCLLHHHAQPAQMHRAALKRREARTEMGQESSSARRTTTTSRCPCSS